MMTIEEPRTTVLEESDNYVKVVVEPLERGFGLTIGHCLKRTLMSSLPGAAAKGIKFASELGVAHEFTSIAGIKEDVPEIVLNIKEINFKTVNTDPDQEEIIHLYKRGTGEQTVVTAEDIELPSGIEITNPEAVICTLDNGAIIDMDITVGYGRGYQGAECNKTGEIGYIAIDSKYAPVTKVCYNVENTRVGQSTDYDRLTMEVWTNGTCSGSDIIALAAQLVSQHLLGIIKLSPKMLSTLVMTPQSNTREQDILQKSIEEMELSVRSYNCLKRANIHTVDDLIKKTKDDMLKVRNLGKKSLDEIELKLASYSLSFKEQED